MPSKDGLIFHITCYWKRDNYCEKYGYGFNGWYIHTDSQRVDGVQLGLAGK